MRQILASTLTQLAYISSLQTIAAFHPGDKHTASILHLRERNGLYG
jgi:hypothetical protein